jgi:hypothetical protein
MRNAIASHVIRNDKPTSGKWTPIPHYFITALPIPSILTMFFSLIAHINTCSNSHVCFTDRYMTTHKVISTASRIMMTCSSVNCCMFSICDGDAGITCAGGVGAFPKLSYSLRGMLGGGDL